MGAKTLEELLKYKSELESNIKKMNDLDSNFTFISSKSGETKESYVQSLENQLAIINELIKKII